MTRNDQSSGSAKIYEFPVGGRRALAGKGKNTRTEPEFEAPPVAFGGSWYHDDAIEEDRAHRN